MQKDISSNTRLKKTESFFSQNRLVYAFQHGMMLFYHGMEISGLIFFKKLV